MYGSSPPATPSEGADHGAFSKSAEDSALPVHAYPDAELREIAKTSGKRWGEFAWNISGPVPVYRALVLVMKSPSLCRGGNNQ
jgi:hypothetical protein